MSNFISAEQLGHSFQDNWLFKGLNLGLNAGQRMALVGVNGAGKSTLMKILSGKIQPQEGKVVGNKELRVGYLDQEPLFDAAQSIAEFIFSMDNVQQQLIRRYEELIEDPNADETEIGKLTDELSNANAWEYEHTIRQILGTLGIHHYEQKIGTLSGGQKKRLALAKLLIDDPDVYILDEPTNHLDIDTIEWLEEFLRIGNKTILLVTHDRYFLDNVCNEVAELENGKVYTYKGNYSYYLEKKAEREAMDASSLEKNLNLLRKELEWMRRQPKARTTKSKSRIDSFYDLSEKTKNGPSKNSVELNVKIALQGNKIIELHHVDKSFDDKNIIHDFSYVFKKGDRIGVAGKNGMGKSTFLNLVTQQILPDKGKVIVGETTVFGYYEQKGLQFDESERVIDIVKNIAEYITMADGSTISASALLTRFLFPPAKQYGMVSKLSGGERKRLHLMRVLIKNPNFLILDEPTNDLDIDTLNVLEEFLLNFKGCILLVSHDRYLVDKLTDQLFIFEGEGNVRVYNGNYTDYRVERDEAEDAKKAALKAEKTKSMAAPAPAPAAKTKLSYKEQKEIETLEKEIAELESKKIVINEKMLSETGVDELIQLANDLAICTALLDEKEMRLLTLI
jgi:ABC transport system ATP-binding/permease protein